MCIPRLLISDLSQLAGRPSVYSMIICIHNLFVDAKHFSNMIPTHWLIAHRYESGCDSLVCNFQAREFRQILALNCQADLSTKAPDVQGAFCGVGTFWTRGDLGDLIVRREQRNAQNTHCEENHSKAINEPQAQTETEAFMEMIGTQCGWPSSARSHRTTRELLSHAHRAAKLQLAHHLPRAWHWDSLHSHVIKADGRTKHDQIWAQNSTEEGWLVDSAALTDMGQNGKPVSWRSGLSTKCQDLC